MILVIHDWEKLNLNLGLANADKVKLNVDLFVKSTVEDMTMTKKMTKLQHEPRT